MLSALSKQLVDVVSFTFYSFAIPFFSHSSSCYQTNLKSINAFLGGQQKCEPKENVLPDDFKLSTGIVIFVFFWKAEESFMRLKPNFWKASSKFYMKRKITRNNFMLQTLFASILSQSFCFKRKLKTTVGAEYFYSWLFAYANFLSMTKTICSSVMIVHISLWYSFSLPLLLYMTQWLMFNEFLQHKIKLTLIYKMTINFLILFATIRYERITSHHDQNTGESVIALDGIIVTTYFVWVHRRHRHQYPTRTRNMMKMVVSAVIVVMAVMILVMNSSKNLSKCANNGDERRHIRRNIVPVKAVAVQVKSYRLMNNNNNQR